MGEFDLDSKFGKRSLKRFYDAMSAEPPNLPSRGANTCLDKYLETVEASKHDGGTAAAAAAEHKDPKQTRQAALRVSKDALAEIGILDGTSESKAEKGEVKVFLNRISGLAVAKQNLVFSLFMSTMDDVVAEAKATGEFQGSVEDIKATTIEVTGEPEVIAVDKASAATTKLMKFELDRGISFTQATAMCEECASEVDSESEAALSGFYISKRKIMGRKLVLFAKRKYNGMHASDASYFDPYGTMILTRPNTGANPCGRDTAELQDNYKLVATVEEVQQLLISSDVNDAGGDADNGEVVVEGEGEKAVNGGSPNTEAIAAPVTCSAEETKKANDSGSANGEDEDGTEVTATCVDLTAGSSQGGEATDADAAREKRLQRIRDKYPNLCSIWDKTHEQSDSFNNKEGLAPRRSRLGIVTGAVLHVLPTLEKAVAARGTSDRALKVLRVEVTSTGQRVVGVKFPLDKAAVQRLQEVLKEFGDARQAQAPATWRKIISTDGIPYYHNSQTNETTWNEPAGFTDSNSFSDTLVGAIEGIEETSPYPIDEKSVKWCTTKPKTMHSFFGGGGGGSSSGSSAKLGSSKSESSSNPRSSAASSVGGGVMGMKRAASEPGTHYAPTALLPSHFPEPNIPTVCTRYFFTFVFYIHFSVVGEKRKDAKIKASATHSKKKKATNAPTKGISSFFGKK
jgi:hypothetical protein